MALVRPRRWPATAAEPMGTKRHHLPDLVAAPHQPSPAADGTPSGRRRHLSARPDRPAPVLRHPRFAYRPDLGPRHDVEHHRTPLTQSWIHPWRNRTSPTGTRQLPPATRSLTDMA